MLSFSFPMIVIVSIMLHIIRFDFYGINRKHISKVWLSWHLDQQIFEVSVIVEGATEKV